MIRLSHTNLEAVRANPSVLAEISSRRFAGTSRFQYVKLATKRYHDQGLRAALDYIEDSFLARGFRMEHLARYQEYLADYAESFEERDDTIFSHRLLIDLPVGHGVVLSGEVGRLDVRPKGYAAWLYAEREDPDWREELRMPLIQAYVASMMSAPVAEISVGFYFFEPARYDEQSYSGAAIASARREMQRLAGRVATA